MIFGNSAKKYENYDYTPPTTQKVETKKRPTRYIDTNKKYAISEFGEAFASTLNRLYKPGQELILLCIGTDRVTGDSLGPILGYKLERHNPLNAKIYGTLENPVHAKNLEQVVEHIYQTHRNPFVIAIDASLGSMESIGCLTVGEGSIKPGQGVAKELPSCGDMFVTGIVNYNGVMGNMTIQNTRLAVVMKMADIAYYGILRAVDKVA